MGKFNTRCGTSTCNSLQGSLSLCNAARATCLFSRKVTYIFPHLNIRIAVLYEGKNAKREMVGVRGKRNIHHAVISSINSCHRAITASWEKGMSLFAEASPMVRRSSSLPMSRIMASASPSGSPTLGTR